jgi:hypothetical protein
MTYLLQSRSRLVLPLTLGGFASIAAFMLSAASPAAQPLGFEVDVTFSPKAVAKIDLSKEHITVNASWFGEPTKAAADKVDQIGRIDVAREELDITANPGVAHLTAPKADPQRLEWVDGPVSVNINVYSARRNGPDNILACDFFDGELSSAQRAPITLHCSLIEENVPTQAKS